MIGSLVVIYIFEFMKQIINNPMTDTTIKYPR